MQVTLILMQYNGQIKVQHHKYLPNHSQLEEIPDFSWIVGEVSNKHEEVDK